MTEGRIVSSTGAEGIDQRSRFVQFVWHPVASNRERLLFVLAFAVLTAVRFPHALWYGRFWAEDGVVFYANAWTMPWWDAALFSYGGYLNLVANVAGVLAYLVPVKLAPHVTSAVALLISCCPAILLAFARDTWLEKRAVLFAALVIVATPPGAQEVWLNALNGQSILTVCVGIILATETRDGAFGAFQKFILFLAPLSAPGVWGLVPFFFLRATISHSWPRALQGTILLVGCLVQAVYFVDLSGRSLGISPLLLGAVFLVKHVALPLFGQDQSAVIANHVASFFTGSTHNWLLFVVIPLFIAMGCVTATKPQQPSIWFFLAGFTVAVLSYYGARGDRLFLVSVAGSARYAYAPQVLFGLSALSWSVVHSGRTAVLAQFVVIWMLFVGVHDYFWPTAPIFANGPNWREEVSRWEQDPAHELRIWPRGWTMRLPAPKLHQ